MQDSFIECTLESERFRCKSLIHRGIKSGCFVNNGLWKGRDWWVCRSCITCSFQFCLMPRIDVVRSNKFLREFNALSVSVCFSIPPTIFVKCTKCINKNDFSSWSKSEFLLTIYVNQTILGCLSFNDFIYFQDCSNNGIVLLISNV